MHKTTLYLDSETALELRRLAQSTQVSQAKLIREAIAAYVTSKQPRASFPPGTGRFRSGKRNVSARADKLLREAARTRWR